VLFHPSDPGSGIKKLGIRDRDKTSRIRNTEPVNEGAQGILFDEKKLKVKNLVTLSL
jgi:hypothetical protein